MPVSGNADRKMESFQLPFTLATCHLFCPSSRKDSSASQTCRVSCAINKQKLARNLLFSCCFLKGSYRIELDEK